MRKISSAAAPLWAGLAVAVRWSMGKVHPLTPDSLRRAEQAACGKGVDDHREWALSKNGSVAGGLDYHIATRPSRQPVPARQGQCCALNLSHSTLQISH
jgi:hypothetical protein